MRFPSLSASCLIALTVLSVPACTGKDRQDMYDKSSNYTLQDRGLGYNRDDFRNAFRARTTPKGDSLDNIPELAPVIAKDKKNILPQPLVSITVNQDVPIRDVFFELAKQAEVDLELDPTITGSLIFTAYNRPFDQVVDRLCDMAGLRYTFKNNVLRVERDTPFMKTYRVDYIGMQRNYTSSIKSNTSASGSGSSGGGGGGGNNGSTSTIDIKSQNDFWDELSKNVQQIIDATNMEVALTDQSAPVSAPQAIPAVSQQQLTDVSQGGAAAAGGGSAAAAALPNMQANIAAAMGATGGAAGTGTSAPGATAAGGAPGQPAAPAAAVSSGGSSATPVAGLANPTGTNSAVATGANGGGNGQQTYFSVNKQAGLLNVFATQKQHEKIKAYIDQLLRSVNLQVLIEAKVFEVELNDENRLGIDWSYIAGSHIDASTGERVITNGFDSVFDQGNFSTNPITNPGGIFAVSSGNLNAVVTAISRFGTVRALSSPRLSVMNNETAVLNVSRSRVFFKLTIDHTEGTSTSNPRTDVTSEANSVPEGIIITVHPSVDPETNEITMNLRPSITRVVDTVQDPGAAIAAASAGLQGVQSLVPELSVREIDSVVKVHSGKTIIMGGLMQDRTEGTQQAIPLLGEIPVVGNLFRNQIDESHKTEMVIMLRATVIDSVNPDDTDKELYQNMGQDRHPFKL